MPNQRLLMRQIREVLRHKYALGLSEREIGRALGISKSGVGDAIRRARSCELTWPLPDDLTDHALERRLFPSVGVVIDGDDDAIAGNGANALGRGIGDDGLGRSGGCLRASSAAACASRSPSLWPFIAGPSVSAASTTRPRMFPPSPCRS